MSGHNDQFEESFIMFFPHINPKQKRKYKIPRSTQNNKIV